MSDEKCGTCQNFDRYEQEGIRMNDGSPIIIEQCLITGLETDENHEGCELHESEEDVPRD